MIAEIMRKEFGESLVTERLEGKEANGEGVGGITELPSPERLKGKILLKVRAVLSELVSSFDERRVTS